MGLAVKIMMDEHQYILRALEVGRKMSRNILNNGELVAEDFFHFIDFVRNYADKYHHGKEEAILFKLMEEDIGQMAKEGPIRGMLIEHDMGRLYMSRLEEALNKYQEGDEDAKLDIIANTISYTHLLKHHISTEDNTLYPFAEKKLSPEMLKKLEKDVQALEDEQASKEVREKYLNILADLESKYTD